MLIGLNISQYTLIETLYIDFQSGMSVITGETGAGKSILLDAINIAMGARVDASIIRPKQERCEITACFCIDNLTTAKTWLKDNEFPEEEELIIRRIINRNGRSRGFINQIPATVTQLKALSQHLVHIHSQHAAISLLSQDYQRDLLDNALETDLPKQVQIAYKAIQETQKTLDKLRAQSTHPEQLALLRYQLDELIKLNCQADEYQQLEREHKLLANAQQIIQLASNAQKQLEDIGLCEQLEQLLANTRQLPNNNSLTELVNTALINLQEAEQELQAYVSQLELNPERLSIVESRLSEVFEIARKHHVKPTELPEIQAHLQESLDNLTNSEIAIKKLNAEIQRQTELYLTLAKKLSAARQKTALKMAKAIQTQCRQLALENLQLTIALLPHKDNTPRPHGLEHIEFHVQTNKGLATQPLAKIASGGELSRISLSIELQAASTQQIPTLIFDEVDVGIGGKTSAQVGTLLRALGNKAQVICITHQPQVAASGHQHLHVHKHSSAKQTYTQVSLLTPEESQHEIARMLSGMAIQDASMKSAKALIQEMQLG